MHSILDRPWEYDIVELTFRQDPTGENDASLVLGLERDGVLKRLHFSDPRELSIERGFPTRPGGLCIRDISGRGWEDMTIEVTDFEATPGAIRFYARSVEELVEDEVEPS